MYCVHCKSNTETVDIVHTVTRSNRNMLKGMCVQCGRVKSQLVRTPASGGDLVTTINKLTSNIRLPFQKFDGEMHVPGMSYAGPNARLDLWLNDDNTPKEWSWSVDQTDLDASLTIMIWLMLHIQIPATEMLLMEQC